MPLDVVLFDLDNTLYPSSSGLLQMVGSRIHQYLLEHMGLSEEDAEMLRREYYTTHGTTLRGLQQKHDVDPEHYLQYVHDIAMDAFLASDAQLDQVLGLVQARKVIFTNSPAEHARRVLGALGIEQHFEQIFDLRSLQFLPKPHPLTYDIVLKALDADPRRTLLIEDTLPNLRPARELGMPTIWISDEPEAGAELADYVVPDILAALTITLELERVG